MKCGCSCRKSWEYKLARRVVLTTAVTAVAGGLVVLMACDFDDARAAAVIRSIPRTLGAAGWCLHAAWTYKASLYPFPVPSRSPRPLCECRHREAAAFGWVHCVLPPKISC